MRKGIIFIFSLLVIFIIIACNKAQAIQNNQATENMNKVQNEMNVVRVDTAEKVVDLENSFSTVRYNGDYGFDEFLSSGGASSDSEVVKFLKQNLFGELDIGFMSKIFGCSTIAVQNANGEALFGRNFDWNSCDAMVVMSYPENAYASISTVNMDFIKQGAGSMISLAMKADKVKTIAALYAPLDGMNEKGLVISVNMIQDSSNIDQNTEKPDITTTTAIRMILDKAATVDEAVELLGKYDMHASMGMMVHFAIADTGGNSVVVEYIDNEMVVTETPAVTNFYLSKGERYGIGTKQSHKRYEILIKSLEENSSMDEIKVRDVLDQVSKDNFNEFESTQWSIVFNLSAKKATYYHRENYTKGYVFMIE